MFNASNIVQWGNPQYDRHPTAFGTDRRDAGQRSRERFKLQFRVT